MGNWAVKCTRQSGVDVEPTNSHEEEKSGFLVDPVLHQYSHTKTDKKKSPCRTELDPESLAKSSSSRFVALPPDSHRLAQERIGLGKHGERVLRRSWPLVDAQMQHITRSAWLEFCVMHPELYELFNNFRDTPINEINRKKRFNRYISTMSRFIRNVAFSSDAQLVEESLHYVGDVHRACGVRRESLVIFIPFFIGAVKKNVQSASEWTAEVDDAWVKFVNLMIHVMCERMHI